MKVRLSIIQGFFVSALFIVSQSAISFAAEDSLARSGKNAVSKEQDSLKKNQVNQTFEEEDILVDEAEEKKIAPADMKTVQPSSVPSSNDSLQNIQKNAANAADSQKGIVPGAILKPDSTAVSLQKDSTLDTTGKKSEIPASPPKIESIRSVNFAKNLKDYRSPKVAMFMSLLVPGLGQAYTKRYYKTAIFVALEATAIGFSVALSNKGKKKHTEATNFADQNYSYDTMMTYYTDLQKFLLDLSQNEDNPDSAMNAKINNIYYDSLHAFTQAHATISEDYYQDIKSNSFVQGWKDREPTFTQISNNTDSTFFAGHYKYRRNDSLRYLVSRIDTAHGNNVEVDSLLYGYSPLQLEYSKIMSKSNSYYKTAQNILFYMIINHVVSAVDALISAKAYNDALMGKESVWRHISVEQQMVDAGSHTFSGCALKVRF